MTAKTKEKGIDWIVRCPNSNRCKVFPEVEKEKVLARGLIDKNDLNKNYNLIVVRRTKGCGIKNTSYVKVIEDGN